MTAAPKLAYIPDLVEEHFDELQFLWSQRRSALRSATARARDLLDLEERIEGHAAGLLVMGDHLIEFTDSALSGEEELPVFAAAFALLRLGTPFAVSRVADALESAEQKRLAGLREALSNAPSGSLLPRLSALFQGGAPPRAAAALEVLCFNAAVNPAPEQLDRLLHADDAATRASGWRSVAYSGASVPSDWYQRALRDDDIDVQQTAFDAALWNASAEYLPHCRAAAAAPSPAAVWALTRFACVAPPEEYQTLGNVVAQQAAGPQRFRLLGAFGHPYFVERLILDMENVDPAAAVGAANAFEKMTGRNVESSRRVKLPADGKPPVDEFEAEFQDEAFLPDPDLARKAWQELAPTLARSPRICRGMDVSQPLSREQFALLDMESRWEYCLRMRLFSGWQGTPLVLERYPQRF
jgi:uncharacterized protein (TIGR02270 family)